MITLFCAEKLNIFFGIKEPSVTWYLAGVEIFAEATLITIVRYIINTSIKL